jgi:hypothetical protein
MAKTGEPGLTLLVRVVVPKFHACGDVISPHELALEVAELVLQVVDPT